MGIGVGPFLGGMLVNATKDLLSVFYLATFVHFMGALVVWFFIPESLTNQGMNEARRKYKEYQMASTSIWKKMFGFLAPLALFIPRRILEPVHGNGWMGGDLVTDVRSWAPLGLLLPRRATESEGGAVKVRRDWNLTLIAICMGFSVLIMVYHS